MYHPLIDGRTGQLRLEKDFGDWQFSKNWLIQVLLFIKKIFHLEQYYSLEGHGEFVVNHEAMRLFKNDFEAFVDKCILCVEKSIEMQYVPEKTQMQLSKPDINCD